MVTFKEIFSKKYFVLYVKFFVWFFLSFAFYSSVMSRDYFTLFIVILTFLFTFISSFFKKFKIYLTPELELVILLFVYSTLFLGEVENYYVVYWWWDVLMHIGSAIALGFIGLGILSEMDRKGKVEAKPSVLVFFAFCFVLAIGALWEIFEFSMDYFFSLNMQKSGLWDTMGDLIADVLGGLISAVIGYFYLVKEKKKLKRT